MPRGYPIIINLSNEIKERVLKLKAEGMSFDKIGERVGLTRQLVGKVVHPGRTEARKKLRNQYRVHTTINGVNKRYPVNKRACPNLCELCERDKLQSGRAIKLYWHHWNDDKLEMGLWLCRSCHQFVEILEYKGTTFVAKYMELKEEKEKNL